MRLILTILLFTFVSAYAQDTCGISGAYDLTGWEPEKTNLRIPQYTGVIQVTEDRGYYRFEGSADGMVFYGKGLTHDCKTFAFVFSSSDMSESGVSLITRDGSDLYVKWAYNLPNQKGAGKEIWKRKK